MSKEVTIERVDNANFNDFLFLVEKLARYEQLTPPDKQAKERLRRDGLHNKPKYEAYLARNNGQAIGYVIFFFNYSSFLALPTLYLEDIFVLERYRKQGVGESLFRFCVQVAKKKGCGRMEWCVLNWNIPAHHFYEKNKAAKMNWTFYRLDKKQFDYFE
jgi:GNAT superfamily N-acetyltransferase